MDTSSRRKMDPLSIPSELALPGHLTVLILVR